MNPLTKTMIGMQRAMASIGAPIYSDELCGRLLAYAALSGSEDVVLNRALNGAILVAQDTFNIKGGEVPDMAKMVYWRKAMQDLRDLGTASEWFPAFAERYAIDPRRWPILTAAFKENFVYFEGAMTARKVGRVREGDEEIVHVFKTRLRGDEEDAPAPATISFIPPKPAPFIDTRGIVIAACPVCGSLAPCNGNCDKTRARLRE